MRRIWQKLMACLVVLGLLGSIAVAESPDMPVLDWAVHPLCVHAVFVNPEHIVDNPAPETDQYILIRFKCEEGAIPIYDVIENIESFWLEDMDEEYYPALAYMPHAMVFNERNGVFSTAGEQSVFDLFFIVPVGVPVEELFLFADDAELPLSEAVQADIVMEAP